jgi:hypothetical protein
MRLGAAFAVCIFLSTSARRPLAWVENFDLLSQNPPWVETEQAGLIGNSDALLGYFRIGNPLASGDLGRDDFLGVEH